MDSQIEEIKNKLNVLDIVGSYVKLTKTGTNWRGLCPFHSERKPSFFVTPARQMWHCFGCGEGSSIFDFIMKIEGVEFGDALRMLAAKAGVELKRENVQLRTERQRLYEVCELATKFFEKQLEASGIGREAEAYLLGRGITKESIKKWRLGYSPDTWNGLTDFLIGQGYERQEVVKAGLAIEKPSSAKASAGKGAKITDSYDRFRGRIIFSVFGLNSEVLGFGGRVFSARGGSALGGKQPEENIAKYINTPQTLLYDKSGILYGLNNAKLAVRKQNQCVVTEGYTDVIMCHQAGYENTVAASGTALTQKHLVILKRYTDNLVLAFDMDVAGDSATKRGINLAQELGFNLKIIGSYGDSHQKSDPAEIILKDPKVWEASIAGAKSIMDYYVDSAFAHFDAKSPEGKKEIGNIVLPAIKRLANKIEQSHWVQKLSQKLDIKEEAILEELSKIKGDAVTKFPIPLDPQGLPKAASQFPIESAIDKNTGVEGRKKLIEEKLIALVLKNPEHILFVEEEHYPLFSEKTKQFLQALQKGEPNAELENFTAALALKGDLEYQEDGKDEIILCLLQLKRIELKNALDKVSDEIKKAEVEGDQQKLAELMEKFNLLTKQL